MTYPMGDILFLRNDEAKIEIYCIKEGCSLDYLIVFVRLEIGFLQSALIIIFAKI